VDHAKPQTILIVEDDRALRYMYRTALTLAGYLVREAGDGYDALRQIGESPPDLVVLDLMLPTVSGLAVQQEIAAQVVTRNIPSVIVTGSPLPVDEESVACLLRKPILPETLVATVAKCIQGGARSARH
jgi:two-component system phosphate regulon response regulator PhoB